MSIRACLVCFDALYRSKVHKQAAVREVTKESVPFFVEWRFRDQSVGNAGSTLPHALNTYLWRLAVIAGTNIAPDQFAHGLECAVFVLNPPMPLAEWQLGVHGLIARGVSQVLAVLLPHAIVQARFTKEAALAHMQAYQPVEIQCFTVQSYIATYDEWLKEV